MKLSAKLGCAFGIMVLITAILGYESWAGLSEISTNVALEKQGFNASETLNQCGSLRRDFATHGFESTVEGEPNAAQKWEQAYTKLNQQLGNIEENQSLSQANRQLVAQARNQATTYQTAFQKQTSSRTMKDEAFASWGKVGWSITEANNKVFAEVISPAWQAAQQSNDLQGVANWSNIANSLNEDVVQQFLLLRVCAVYLVATQRDTQWVNYGKQLQNTKDGLAKWSGQVSDNSQLKEVASQIKDYIAEYEVAGNKFYQGIIGEREAEAQMIAAAGTVQETINNLSKSLSEEMNSVTAQTTNLMIGMTTVGVILGVILAIAITRGITKPLQGIFKGLKTFSCSELEETGSTFKRIIAGLSEGVSQANDAAAQVASASQQLAEGASEQASSLEETSSALEEMSAMTQTNAANARKANEVTASTHTAAQQGDQTMAAINQSSDDISKIIKVIEEIAFQTNLLALNAAVEAARAGEHGKGFAVVAEEVRNLAQRSAQAAQETTTLIEDSVGKTREGTEAIQAIVRGITQVTDLVNGITQASEEQAQGVEQVNIAVSQMDKVTQTNAASAEESASAAEELSAQAATTMSMVQELTSLIEGTTNQNRVATSHVKSSMQTVSSAASHSSQSDGWKAVDQQAESFLALDDDIKEF